jgi:hypothetical protein
MEQDERKAFEQYKRIHRGFESVITKEFKRGNSDPATRAASVCQAMSATMGTWLSMLPDRNTRIMTATILMAEALQTAQEISDAVNKKKKQ